MKRKTLLLSFLLMILGGASSVWAQKNLLSDGGVTITCQKGSENLTLTTNEDTKSITYSSDDEIKLELTFSPAVKIDASQAYVVVEASDAFATTKKLRNITLNGTIYDQGGGANCAVKEINDHQVILMNPIGRNGSIFDAYVNAGDNQMELTKVGFNLKASSSGDFTIYRIGFYNIAEIESLYDDVNLQFYGGQTHALRYEFGGSTPKKIEVSGNNGPTLTVAEAGVLFKSFGNLPEGYSLNFRNLNISDGAPFKKDVMTNLSNVSKVLLGADNHKYFPTMNTNVAVLSNRHYQYKDGTIPTSVIYCQDGNNSYNMSYTRRFIEGYSTMMVPFEIDPTYLETLGITAYIFTDATEDGQLTFTKATEQISHSTPLIVKVDAAGLYMIPRGASSPVKTLPGENDYKNNDYISTAAINNISFVGSYKANKVPDGGYAAGASCVNYGITADGTSLAQMGAETKSTYYRAFISDKRTAGVKAFKLSFDDGAGTTEVIDIKDVHGLGVNGDGVAYTLSGQRVKNPRKGLYIANGKKVFIK